MKHDDLLDVDAKQKPRFLAMRCVCLQGRRARGRVSREGIDFSSAYRQNAFMMKKPTRSKAIGILAAMVTSLSAQTAGADAYSDFKADFTKSVETFLLLTGASLIADVTFTIHDVWLLNNGERQNLGWSIAETALTAPQAIFLDYGVAWAHARGDADDILAMDVLAVLPAIWTTQLTTHGIWSIASDQVHLGDLYGLSWAIGANLTFTVGAVSGAFGKRFGGPVFGVIEMVGTAPSIAVGLYRSVRESEPDRAAWIALSAWSGALFLHGLASTIIPSRKKKNETEAQPRAPFMLAPTVVSDGIRQMPGIAMRGVF
jgi:hypothetical protein